MTRSPATEKLARRIAESIHTHGKDCYCPIRELAEWFEDGEYDDILSDAVVSERMRRYLLQCAKNVEATYESTPGGDHTFAAELRKLAGEE